MRHANRYTRFAAVVAVLAGGTGVWVSAPASARATETTPTTPGKTTSVSASLRYTDGSKSEVPVWSDIQVSIVRNGATVVDGQALPPTASSSFFTPPKLLTADLDDDFDPEVIVDVFTAGYDCCRRTVVLHRDAAKYEPLVIDWGASNYRLANVTGAKSPEFVSTDSRFPALYADKAARGPIRIQRFRDGTLVDISQKVASQLRRDAKIQKRLWKKAMKGKKVDARPAVAAYAIDLARLGRIDEARRVIHDAGALHRLHATADRFARQLDGRLKAWGYSKRAVFGRISGR
jgi:hypothetical protein